MPDLQNLEVEWVSIVDRAAVRDTTNKNEPQKFLVWKAENGGSRDPEGGSMTDQEMREAIDKAEHDAAELRKQLEDQTTLKADLKKAQDDLAALTAKVAKAAEEDPAKIDKAELPKAVREALEKAEAREKDMADRLEKAEKTANAERDERLTRDFIAKAETFEALPVTPGDFGLVLKSIHGGVDEKVFEQLETVLKAADEQISKGELFKEQGRAGDPTPQGAVAEALAKAEEIRKSDPKLSQADAMDVALSNDRALQARYLDEVR